jgi:hypothetical protein
MRTLIGHLPSVRKDCRPFRRRLYPFLDIDAASRRILRSMLQLPPDPAWQFPWLRLHLVMRDVLAVPWGKDWPIVKRELARCAELRRAMIQAGWFN